LVDSGTARFQMRFSVQHLMAAAQFSRRVGEIEHDNAGQQIGPFFDEILWHATACVFCCVASLEAYANEFFIDREEHFPELRQEVANRFWEEWHSVKLNILGFKVLRRKTPARRLIINNMISISPDLKPSVSEAYSIFYILTSVAICCRRVDRNSLIHKTLLLIRVPFGSGSYSSRSHSSTSSSWPFYSRINRRLIGALDLLKTFVPSSTFAMR